MVRGEVMKELEGSRVLLRNWNMKDVDHMFEWAKDDRVGPNAGWKPHTTKEETMVIINSFILNQEVWCIESKKEKKPIGSIGLHVDKVRDNPQALMIGYVLSPKYWGQGLMVECCELILKYAFEELNKEIITIDHFDFNYQSRRVIEKLGFKYEGTLRKAKYRYDGLPINLCCYSMTREEYYEKRS